MDLDRPLSAVLSDFDETKELPRASTLPGSWYTADRVHALEERGVFEATWQFVGRVSQVDKPGQFLTATVGRLSVRREAGENLFHRLLAADVRRAAIHRRAAPP